MGIESFNNSYTFWTIVALFSFIMKTVNNLFEKIACFENLLLAVQKASKGKKLSANIRFFGIFVSMGSGYFAHRVVRGGSWNNNDNNCRVSNRNRNTTDARNNNIGFRLAGYWQ
ncbi:MAG: SUMF1/EgtB/PvdO family nonheme iron enzyme [Haliscomenobacter sp.]|nr:SUMF1/EgtB/PvdO family nonheme iron enzyme [Haliscomenobacter sp.]